MNKIGLKTSDMDNVLFFFRMKTALITVGLAYIAFLGFTRTDVLGKIYSVETPFVCLGFFSSLTFTWLYVRNGKNLFFPRLGTGLEILLTVAAEQASAFLLPDISPSLLLQAYIWNYLVILILCMILSDPALILGITFLSIISQSAGFLILNRGGFIPLDSATSAILAGSTASLAMAGFTAAIVSGRTRWLTGQLTDKDDVVKAMENLFFGLQSNLPGIVFQMEVSNTDKFKFTFISPGIQKIVGVDSETLLSEPNSLLGFIHPDDLPRLLDAMKYEMDTKSKKIEARLLVEKENWQWFQIIITTFQKTPEGKKFNGLGLNINDYKLAEEATLAAKTEAEKANSAKSDFLANMSHELRTPLNGILGMTDIIGQTSLSHEQRDYLGIIKNSGEMLLKIINDILDFSRLEAGRMSIDAEPFHLETVITDVTSSLAASAARKNLDLVLNIAPNIPHHTLGAPDRIRQVLFNIAGNAVKFTEKGHVVINVTCLHTEGMKSLIQFSVEDTGPGIPKSLVPQLFQKFVQADSGPSRKHPGTGLGLAISRQLINLMGGDINVTTKQNHGSSFVFTIPLTTLEDLPELSEADKPDRSCILIDAHDIRRENNTLNLHNWGYRVNAFSCADDWFAKGASAAGNHGLFIYAYSGNNEELEKIGAHFRGTAENTVKILLYDIGSHKDIEGLHVESFAHRIQSPLSRKEIERLGMIAAHTKDLNAPDGSGFRLNSNAAGLSALIVEDNSVNQKVLQKLLEKYGMEIHIADTGREGIRLCENNFYHLIFMDCQMPELDGGETTRILRQRNCKAIIIAVTGYALKRDRDVFMSSGMDDYLTKPISQQDLDRCLSVWVPRIPLGDTKTIEPEGTMDSAPMQWNKAKALMIVGDDEEILHEVVTLFLDQYDKKNRELQAAVESGDLESIKNISHTLKGSSGTVGAEILQQLYYEMEMAARNDPSFAFAQTLGKILEEAQAVAKILNRSLHEGVI